MSDRPTLAAEASEQAEEVRLLEVDRLLPRHLCLREWDRAVKLWRDAAGTADASRDYMLADFRLYAIGLHAPHEVARGG